jgi:hypothetical protein
MIVKHIEENGYRRPCYNCLRNDDSNNTTAFLNIKAYETMQLM